ncbi:MAG TPA: hypothetical protein VL262_07690 [Vicinamibacterales bacterium]|jgi:hypothetical protein|nr:hypothetical protein [Vicinamibacterales bacterium]
MTTLPPLARALSRLIPAADRQVIIGDLLEDADWRGLHGGRLTLSLCAACGAIGAGLAFDNARAALTWPSAGELVAGLTVDGSHLLRGLTARACIMRAFVFGAGVFLLARGVEILIASLMIAADLR